MIAKRITPVTMMRRVLVRFGSPAMVAVLLLAGLLLACSFAQLPAAAQASGLEDGPPPPPEDKPSPPSPASEPAPSSAASEPTAPTAPMWDPLHAKKSMDVGTFYMKKGDYDAAIDRFQEAARLQPGLARPFLLLGEAYEKKSDLADAVTSYRKYLDLYRTAPDRAQILKRIEKLESQAPREETQRGSG